MTYFHYQRQHNLYPVPFTVVDAAVEHAKQEYPNESCGLVYGDEYIPVANVHEYPTEHYRMDHRQYTALLAERGTPDCAIHSHPDGDPAPSYNDTINQIECGYPFGIVCLRHCNLVDVVFWGDGVPIAPYEGRPFKHGIYDCFALGRDIFKQEYGISIKNYPRAPHWWNREEGGNLLEDNVRNEGFFEIDFRELRRGDILLGRIRSRMRINHCAVYWGNGLIMHHLYGTPQDQRVSCLDNLYQWKQHISLCMRHKDLA